MIRWIIEASLQFRLLIIAIAVALLAVGITQWRTMPVDVLPEFNPPLVEIQTEALGLSAEEVEQMITVPMEQDLLNGVPWLREIRSDSVPGLSSIGIRFDEGTDLIRARQMVTERLAQAFALPHVSKPPTMLQPLSATNRVMMIGLSSKNLSLIEMSVLARWTISPRLMGVPGVANVAIWGQRDRQLQVQVDPQQLKAKNVSLLQILETTGNSMWVSSLSFLEASTPGTGGFVDTPNQRLGVRHILPISSAAGLAKVPVEEAKLTLGDVAKVVEDHQPLIGDAVGAAGPSLLLVVEKLPGANTLDVTRDLEDALTALRPGLPGLELDSSVFKPAGFIEMTLANLRWALLAGAILLLVLLFAFFFAWRTALISFIAVPMALIVAGGILALRGATLNMMLLAGLAVALGVVADDAIVDVENIARRLRQQRATGTPKSTPAMILDAAFEMRGSVIFATLIVLLPLLPVFFIRDQSGAFLQPLLSSYVLAVLASLVVALTVTPALCVTLLSNPRFANSQPSPLVRGLQRGYASSLARVLRMPTPALIVLALIGLVSIGVLPFFKLALTPTFKEPDLLIRLDSAPGTSQPEMDRIVARVSQELRALPGVRNVGAHVGRAVMSDRVVNVNASELWVTVDPAGNYAATTEAIQKAVAGYPGLKSHVQTYLGNRSAGLLTESSTPLGVRVFGEEFTALRSTAEEVKKALTGIPGLVDLRIKHQEQEPTLQVKVDMTAAQRYGIKPGDVRRTATTLLSGLQVGSLFEESKVFDVVVIGTADTRRSVDSMKELLIDTPDGGHVRLGDVAQVSIVSVPSNIQHQAISRYIDINLTVQGRDLSAVAGDIQQRLQQVKFPLEFHAEVFGDYAEQRSGLNRMIGFIVIAVLGIFLLMQAIFGGWRLTLFYALLLPLALVGGVFAAYFTGATLALGSLFGLLTVFGITARNGLLLMEHYHHLQRAEGEHLGPALIVRGAQERLAPILLTAFATALALIPFAVGGERPGYEFVHPLAVVVIGGLVTATLLNLFIAPILYLHWGVAPQEEKVIVVAGHEPSFMAAD
ncbi:MAG: efflux RND transporter permease subunit [Caldilineaceae bacterium]